MPLRTMRPGGQDAASDSPSIQKKKKKKTIYWQIVLLQHYITFYIWDESLWIKSYFFQYKYAANSI